MRTAGVGKIVIETNKETGLDDVELTLDNGQVLKFSGVGRSELRHVRSELEYWHFSLSVDRIPEIDMEDPA